MLAGSRLSQINPPTTLGTFSKPHGIPASMLQIRPTQFHLKMLSPAVPGCSMPEPPYTTAVFPWSQCQKWLAVCKLVVIVFAFHQIPHCYTSACTTRVFPLLIFWSPSMALATDRRLLTGCARAFFGLACRRFGPVGVHDIVCPQKRGCRILFRLRTDSLHN